MSFSSWSVARIALIAAAWIVGLPFALFVASQVWVIWATHADTGGLNSVSLVHVNLLLVFLVLLGPPILLVACWALARRHTRGA